MLTLGAQQDPYSAIQLNIMGTINVFEAARILDVERVVWCSSSVLYHYLTGGEDQGAEGKEEAWPRTDTFYASTKLACENLGLNYAKWCGLDVVAVRYAAVFGPWKGRGGGGPTNMFREMVEKTLKGEEASLPQHRMEFVYSKGAALGTVLACYSQDLKNRIFNIGMGEAWDTEQVASMLPSGNYYRSYSTAFAVNPWTSLERLPGNTSTFSLRSPTICISTVPWTSPHGSTRKSSNGSR